MDLEALERSLTVLEEKLFAALTAAAPEELLVGLEGARGPRTCALSQPHGCRATAPGGAPVCAEAIAGALQPAAPQPVLHEPAMRRRRSQSARGARAKTSEGEEPPVAADAARAD